MNITTCYYQTPAGVLQVSMQADRICAAIFVEDSTLAFNTLKPVPQELTYDNFEINGTPFERMVWQAVYTVARGQTCTYQQLAQSIGRPRAWRAVARALAHNKIAYFIPCHRVIRSDGSLSGYRWGVARKQTLLNAEKIS